MSLLKYPGGKEQELPIIIQNLPQKIDNYFEPFVGGGTVYLNIQAENFFINDKSEELVNLYNSVKEQNNDFFSTLEHIEYNWNLLTSIVITDFFKLKSIYLKFKSSELNKNKLFDSVNKYILENIKSFSEMFQVPYNYYIDNFVKEINKNLIS
ncbi:MAG: DNA adenine methylase, partial [Alphaproteobacteria bacterium]|nr:DNA adenine methylase [Alphaproteobacteria bacterium]